MAIYMHLEREYKGGIESYVRWNVDEDTGERYNHANYKDENGWHAVYISVADFIEMDGVITVHAQPNG